MTGISKRMIGLAVPAVAVLGTASIAMAAAGPALRQPYGIEQSALEVAGVEPDPAAPARAKREELRACVKPKVDAGADRKTSLRECADQLGIEPGAGTPARPGKGGGKVPALGRGAHADVVVPKKGAEGQWETIQVDRGKVTGVSVESISLQRPDGSTVTLKVVAATKLKGIGKVTDLAVGREVVVVSAGGDVRSNVARR